MQTQHRCLKCSSWAAQGNSYLNAVVLLLALSLNLSLSACSGGSPNPSSANAANTQQAAETQLPAATGERSGFHSVLPPGQKGIFNGSEALQANGGIYPEFSRDQLDMFAALAADNVVPGFRNEQVDTYFKPSPIEIAPENIGRQYAPAGRDDVVVYRDKDFDVPHIVGTTRAGTMFASGYVTAEDRLFLMEILRAVGSARMAEFLGPSEANIAMDRSILDVAPYRPEEYQQVFDRIGALGPRGQQALEDFDNYIAGINAFVAEVRADPDRQPAEYAALQKTPQDWVTGDVAAIGALIGAFFGKGGGNELRNYCALQTMAAAVGDADQARAMFDDLMLLDDPESPRHVEQPFPFLTDLGPVGPDGVPDIDCASLRPIDENGPGVESGPAGVFNTLDAITGSDRAQGTVSVDAGPLGMLPLNLPASMSNALLVSGEQTQSGNPISVMGPQLSFFMPQIFVEKSIIGPGIRARGAGFPGTDVYIEIGRGNNYAWSATTSRADIIDHFVLILCESDGSSVTVQSMGYLHDGQCKPIEEFIHTEVAAPTGGGAGAPQILQFKIQRTTDYGPLIARGQLQDGRPMAVASLRSTYLREVDSILAFQFINDPDFMANGEGDIAGGPDAFREALSKLDYVFNWLYIDQDNIAYQHSCLCPQRAQGVDPMLPKWGDGRFDWNGVLSKDQNPHVVNPTTGYLSSWNNKQALGWATSDDNPWWGPAFRPVFFEEGIAAAFAEPPKLDRAKVIDIVQGAATKDLRGDQLVELLAEVMGNSAPSGTDTRALDMLQRLQAWEQGGAHRLDRDGDGNYEHAQAVAIMDAWWNELVDVVFNSRTGNFFINLGMPLHQAPQTGQGFAFGFGPYSHVHKDLRQVLGQPVLAPFSRGYCGDGDADDCAAELWASLSTTAAALEQEFGSANVDDWQRQVADDAIRHSAAGVVNVPAIPYQNRPTYQLVIEVQ